MEYSLVSHILEYYLSYLWCDIKFTAALDTVL